MKRKIAITGLGAAAKQIHLAAYANLANLEVVGGQDPLMREGGFAFPPFSSIDELLEKTSPDILAAVTPTAHHYEITRKGLLAGCHVFCEKPFMASMEQANEITALSREKKRWVVVNNQYRFMNIHSSAKKVIGTPEFGNLLFISANQTFFVSEKTEAGWRGQKTVALARNLAFMRLICAAFSSTKTRSPFTRACQRAAAPMDQTISILSAWKFRAIASRISASTACVAGRTAIWRCDWTVAAVASRPALAGTLRFRQAFAADHTSRM